MTRTRNSLLIALALVTLSVSVSVPPSHAVLTWSDDGAVSVAGSGGLARPDPGPTTGEPDVTGNGAPGKTGTNSTSLQRSRVDAPLPAAETLRTLFRYWLVRLPWTWR